MDASIIIPTHNRRNFVLRAVNALVRQTHPPHSYEIIVSCDRSRDGTEESLRSAFGDRIRVLDSEVPGQAGALNAGLKAAGGKLAIFLDDEMEAEQGLVSAHVEAHRSRPKDKIAVTGYSPVVIDSSSTAYARMVARDYEKYFSELAEAGRKTRPTDLCGSNFSLPVSAAREVGGFNESYFFQRNDFELAVRLLDLKYEIHYCHAARANQHLAVTADILIGRTAERARNDYRLSQEYPWCRPHLPFYSVLVNPARRLRWRVLWETAGLAAGSFRFARRAFPKNLRFANLEYAARYCMGLRTEIGSWRAFRRLVDVS